VAKNAIDIVVNATDNASSKIRGVAKSFDSLHQKAQKAMPIIGAIGAIGGAGLFMVAKEGIKMNATLEESKARWTTLLKSSKKAEKQMAWMKKYAKMTPFDYEGVDRTATSLMGMGMSLKEVNQWLPTLGDAAAVLGGGTETVMGLGLALGQMNAKGKVSAEEMQQLAERGVNAWQMLADGMGLTQAEVRKLSEDGKLLAKDALPLIYEGMKKTFGGGTANLMKSTTGQAMEARETFSWLAQTLTSSAYDWFGATVLPLINKGLATLVEMFSGGLFQGFEKLWDSSTKVQVVLLALAGIIMGALIGAIFALAPAIVSAVVAFAPFLAIGMAVAGLAFIIIIYWEPIKSFFVNTFGGLFSAFSNFFMGIWALVQPILSQVVTYILAKIQELSAFWSQHWGSIKQAFVNIWTFISGFISGALQVILAIFNFVFPAIKFIVLSVFENIKGLIDGALKFIMGVVQVFAGLFTGNWTMLWNGIKSILSGAVQFIWNFFQLFFVGKILGVLGKFAGKGISLIKEFASKAGSAVSSFVSKVVSYFAKMVSQVISKIKSWVSNMASAIDSFVYKVLGRIAKFNTDLALLFSRGWEALKGIVRKGISSLISVVKGMFGTFTSAGRGLIDAFTKGITGAFSKAVGAVKSGLSKIRNLLPFSPAKEGPLSDLDKSGESFFPTWYDGVLKKVPKMTKVLSGAMKLLNSDFQKEAGTLTLNSFTGGRSKVTVIHRHEHSGKVQVEGDTSKEVVHMVGGSLRAETEESFLVDLRRVARSR
jgi:tape measure domain-containing protein